MVLGIFRVDGEQRQSAQVFAALQLCRLHGLGFAHFLVGETHRHAMGMQRNDAAGTGRVDIAEDFENRGGLQPVSAFLGELAHDQGAIIGLVGFALGRHEFMT